MIKLEHKDQKFKRGDLVYITRKMPKNKRYHPKGKLAIISGSHYDKFNTDMVGNYDIYNYTVLLRRKNPIHWSEVSWFDEGELKLITNQKIINLVQKEINAQKEE